MKTTRQKNLEKKVVTVCTVIMPYVIKGKIKKTVLKKIRKDYKMSKHLTSCIRNYFFEKGCKKSYMLAKKNIINNPYKNASIIMDDFIDKMKKYNKNAYTNLRNNNVEQKAFDFSENIASETPVDKTKNFPNCEEKKCKFCGTLFSSNNPRSIYCSDSCKTKMYQERKLNESKIDEEKHSNTKTTQKEILIMNNPKKILKLKNEKMMLSHNKQKNPELKKVSNENKFTSELIIRLRKISIYAFCLTCVIIFLLCAFCYRLLIYGNTDITVITIATFACTLIGSSGLWIAFYLLLKKHNFISK